MITEKSWVVCKSASRRNHDWNAQCPLQCQIITGKENRSNSCVSFFYDDEYHWHILKFPCQHPYANRTTASREDFFFLSSDSPVSIDHRFQWLKRVQPLYTPEQVWASVEILSIASSVVIDLSMHVKCARNSLVPDFVLDSNRWPIDWWWVAAKIICVICV